MFSRMRGHIQRHAIAYVALGIAVSGGTAYAANEWTGDNIVDESLTDADLADDSVGAPELDEASLGRYDSGLVRIDVPSTVGVRNRVVLLRTHGITFVGECSRLSDDRPLARVNARYPTGALIDRGGGTGLSPPVGPGDGKLASASSFGDGIPRGSFRDFHIVVSSETFAGIAWAAVNVDGTDACDVAVTIP